MLLLWINEAWNSINFSWFNVWTSVKKILKIKIWETVSKTQNRYLSPQKISSRNLRSQKFAFEVYNRSLRHLEITLKVKNRKLRPQEFPLESLIERSDFRNYPQGSKTGFSDLRNFRQESKKASQISENFFEVLNKSDRFKKLPSMFKKRFSDLRTYL